ncbi:MAG: T9SS type A sorting domain-containing protein [Candidatus Zixiibacteriota bacterium]|nr:MAG: T9SS type A sorting domain-containing protein [candidate division Zixibacteria bacterium]
MAKLLTVFLLTLLSFSTIGAAPFEISYAEQTRGAENYAFIDPIVDVKGQHTGFIYSDQAERRLIVDEFGVDTLVAVDLLGVPVKTIHYRDTESKTLNIYCLVTLPNQLPGISLVSVGSDEVNVTDFATNCFSGYGAFDAIVHQDIRFEGARGVWFEASLRYREDLPGFGSSTEAYSTTILYSRDLRDELYRGPVTSMWSGDFFGDDQHEYFGYTNYEYGYDFRQSGDRSAIAQMSLTTVAVQDSMEIRMTEVTTPQGFSRGALVGNFDRSDGLDEVIFSGVSEDLEQILSGMIPEVVCYSFAGEAATRLWDIEDIVIDLRHVYRDMGLVVGMVENNRVFLIDFENGEIIDSLELGRNLEATSFFETYSNPSTLNLVGRVADSVFIYRFDIFRRRPLTTSDESAPQTFTLQQNYPNPFNGETRLSFETEEAQYLTLKIYNILGQEVTQLAEGIFSPGTYYAYWNGADVNGIMQSSGVYFAKLQSDNSSQIIKLIFLK